MSARIRRIGPGVRGRSAVWALVLVPVLAASAGCAAGAARQAEAAANEIVVLSPEDGAYHLFSRILASELARRLAGEHAVRLVTSTRGDGISGSVDVLDAIARRTEGRVHYLGLSQSDVAYHFRYGGHSIYEVPHAHRERVAALGKAFPEKLYLYSSVAPRLPAPAAPEFDDFQPLWASLYLGEVGSGTLITTYNVFPILSGRPLETPPPGLRQYRRLPDPGAGAAREGVPREELGAFFVASPSSDPVAELIARRGGRLIPLSSSQQRHLISVYSSFYRPGRIAGSPGGPAGDDDADGAGVPTLEIPALLVADRALPEEVALAVYGFLDELAAPEAARRLVDRHAEEATPEAEAVRELIAAAAGYARERFVDLILPAHRTLVDLPAANYVPPLLLAVAALILLVLLLRSCVVSSRSGVVWLDMPRTTVLGSVLALTLLWFHGCLAAVMVLERRAYLGHEIEEPSLFIQRDYLDLLPRLMHYMASGFSMQELIPQAYVAQLVWLSIPFVVALSVLGGTLHVALPPVVRYLSRNLKGETVLKTDDHVLIVHWHRHAIHVVRQLADHALLEGREAPRFLVVSPDGSSVEVPVVAERADPALGHYSIRATTAGGPQPRRIELALLERDPRAEGTLELVGLARARIVILFPLPDHPEPDSVSVMLLLRMQQILGDEPETARPKVLVWAHDPANVPLLMDDRLGADDVCSTEWAWRILCQATYVDGVSNVYRRLMVDTVDGEELYELVLPRDWTPRSFGSLLSQVWTYNAERAETLAENGKRNVVSLVGLAKGDDRRKRDVELCPDPQRMVEPGDRLLLITYKLDPRTRSRLLEDLTRFAREGSDAGVSAAGRSPAPGRRA